MSFICQQCKEPLLVGNHLLGCRSTLNHPYQLDASLVDLAPSAYDMTVASLPQPNPPPLSNHLRSTLRLFNLLSTRTDIDHPLCAECTQILLSSLQRQLDETKKERDGYIAFEKEVRKEKEREGKGMNKEEAEKKIEKLKVEEHMAIEQLTAAEREQAQLDEDLKALELEEKTLEEEEAEFVLFTSYPIVIPSIF